MSFNALIDANPYEMSGPPVGLGPDDGTPSTQQAMPNHSDLQGTMPLTGLHNTPLHVAALAIAALLVVIALRAAGFRFSTVGKLSVGRS